jgi:hypothetical protein
MIPSSLNVIVIGASVPPVVEYCLEKNALICRNYSINFRIHRPARDLNYPSPGIQAEAKKLMLHTHLLNSMVIDWDIEMIGFPEVPADDYPYLGRTESNKNDLFLSYCNSYKAIGLIHVWIDALLNIHSFPHVYGTGIIFTNLYKNYTLKYPDNAYIHYRTLCGYTTIADTYGSLPESKKSCLDGIAKTKYESGGKQWPI